MSTYPHPTVKGLALTMTRTTSRWIAWVWAAVALILLIVGLSLSYFDVPMHLSLVDMAGTPARYWMMALGVGLALEWRYYVAAGVTRRTFTTAGLLASVAASGSMTVSMALLYAVEYQIYATLGWKTGFGNPNLFSAGIQTHLVIAQYLVLFLVHVVAGWLLVTAFQRLRAWALPLIIPVAVLVYTAEGLMGSGWFGGIAREQFGFQPRAVMALIGGGVVVAILCTGVMRFMRDIPMAPKTN